MFAPTTVSQNFFVILSYAVTLNLYIFASRPCVKGALFAKINTLHLALQTLIYRTDLPLPTNEIKKTQPKEKPPARAGGQKCKTKANI